MTVTNVYIDGFNLYYGCLRESRYKWLDICRLCDEILDEHTIKEVHYFTARVKGRPTDPQQPLRQNVYLRALNTDPRVTIHFGHFTSRKVSLPRADGTGLVKVIKSEEKGSDVNLAVRLVADAFADAFDCGVVLSNDSDLASAMRVARDEVGKDIGLINPHPGRTSKQLLQHASFVRSIRGSVLARCQLPERVALAHGSLDPSSGHRFRPRSCTVLPPPIDSGTLRSYAGLAPPRWRP